jgi:hypothetical protein
MGIWVKTGDRLFGTYKVIAELRERDNAIYQWVRAVKPDGQTVVVQLLVAAVDSETRLHLLNYFDTLKSIRRQGLWVPTEVLCDQVHPLVAVYPDLPAKPLRLEPSPVDTDDAVSLKWLNEASEALFALHNKRLDGQRLLHGHVTPESFMLVEGTVYLTDFGYAPLLEHKHLDTLRVLQQNDSFVAPEIAQPPLTLAADAYAFAKIASHWQPRLIETDWYRQATAPNPSDRFPRMRELFDALKRAFATLSGTEAKSGTEAETTPQPDPPPAEPPPGSIVPKFMLEVKLEPAAGGSVKGAGNHRAGAEVTVKAMPAPNWQFSGWSGDLSGTVLAATVVMNAPKTIVARFTQIPQACLSVQISPASAGAATGAGSYPLGTEATLRVSPAPQWQFSHWAGALSGSQPEMRLKMDGDKQAIAHFTRVPVSTPPPSPPPATPKKSSVPKWAGTAESATAPDSGPEPDKKPSVPKWAGTAESADLDPAAPNSPTPETEKQSNLPKWAETDPPPSDL